MRAVEIAGLAKARERRPGEFVGPCPIHGGRSKRALSIRQAEDRVLLLCRAGCPTSDVLVALGLRFRDLYESEPPNDIRQRYRAARGLERWRKNALEETAELLRTTRATVKLAAARLEAEPDRDGMWDVLGDAYHTLTTLEYDQDRLLSRDVAQHLAVWRERQEDRTDAA